MKTRRRERRLSCSGDGDDGDGADDDYVPVIKEMKRAMRVAIGLRQLRRASNKMVVVVKMG